MKNNAKVILNNFNELYEFFNQNHFFSGIIATKKDDKFNLLNPSFLQGNFPMGSISKSLAYHTFKELFKKKSLNPQQPLGDFFKTKWRSHTLKELLDHQTLIPNYIEAPLNLDLKKRFQTKEELQQHIESLEKLRQPVYSNSNYIYLSLVLEKFTKKDSFQAVKEISGQYVDLSCFEAVENCTNIMDHYSLNQDLEVIQVEHTSHLALLSGGFCAPVEDIMNWCSFFRKTDSSNYMGAFEEGVSLLSGSYPGFKCFYLYFMKEELEILVCTNNEYALNFGLLRCLAAIVQKGRGEHYFYQENTELDHIKFTEGTYELPQSKQRVILSKQGKKLYYEIKGQEKFRAFPLDSNIFFLKQVHVLFEQLEDGIKWHQNNQSHYRS
ncbi:MAG: serine hydrolase [Bacteriovoracaceae bacterium]